MNETTAVAPAAVAPIMGFLNINKPAGWTSHDVVAKVRGLLRASGAPKVGHVGTLDPMATGVLPLCVGKATKVSDYVMASKKSYRAVMKLGERTETQDATGAVLTSAPVDAVDRARVDAACREFVGTIQQLPPMYSAVKIGGAPLYKAARAGQVVERTPRSVVIEALRILSVDGPLVTFDVDCSKGTYIRTLCADIGDRLGVGAHLFQLQRRRVGDFVIEEAVGVTAVEAAAASGGLSSLLVSVDRALAHLPALLVDTAAAERVRHGAGVSVSSVRTAAPLRDGDTVRVCAADGELLAIGGVAGGTIRLHTVLAA